MSNELFIFEIISLKVVYTKNAHESLNCTTSLDRTIVKSERDKLRKEISAESIHVYISTLFLFNFNFLFSPSMINDQFNLFSR